MENNELAHAGIKGMRWGIRRFQNKDGSLTPEGKKRYGDKDEDSDKTPETPEERKARILRSGTAEEVMKYQGQLTNKELNDAVQRIRIENELNQITASQRTRGVDKFKKVMDDVDTIRGGVEKGLSAWNTVAKINNTFNGKKQLPTIDGKYFKTDKNKADREESLRKLSPDDVAKDTSKYSTSELNDLNTRFNAIKGIKNNTKNDIPDDNDTPSSNGGSAKSNKEGFTKNQSETTKRKLLSESKKEKPKQTMEEIQKEAEKKRKAEEKASKQREREEKAAAKQREREEAAESRAAEKRMKKFAKDLKVNTPEDNTIYSNDFRDVSSKGSSAIVKYASNSVVTASNVSTGRAAVDRVLALPAASTPMLPAKRDDK